MKPASFARQTVCVVFLASSVTVGAPVWAAAYTITDLGTLGGSDTRALGINNSGQVVGESAGRAFLWSNGAMTNLGTLPGLEDGFSWAYDINKSGQVVGSAAGPDGSPERPFLWTNGKMTDLGTPYVHGGSAISINSSGQAAGWVWHETGEQRAYLWSNGAMTDLGTLGGRSNAYGINDSGQVVGDTYTVPWIGRAFLWSNGTMTDLGTVEGQSHAEDINNTGQVVGWFTPYPGQQRSFLWSDGTITDLGSVGGALGGSSRAFGINDHGQVVGETGDYHAFLWSNGMMKDLNRLIDPALGWTLVGAEDINNAGQIVGTGTLNGQTRAYLLTPVPEADSYAYMAVGLGLVGWMARRRKAARSSSPLSRRAA